MPKRDYYAILGLSPKAKSADIKRVYKALALKWHPDKNQNKQEAALRFNEIQEAYSVLIDEKQRKIYDQYGHQGIERLRDGLSPVPPPNPLELFQAIFFERKNSGTYNKSPAASNTRNSMMDLMEDHIGFSDLKRKNSDFLKSYQPTFMKPDFLNLSSDVQPTHEEKMQEEAPLYFEDAFYQRTENTKLGNNEEKISNFGFQVSWQNTYENLSTNSGSFEFEEHSTNLNRASSVISIHSNEEKDQLSEAENGSSLFDQSFMDELEMFENSLNSFHYCMEKSLNKGGYLQKESKKIFKMQKPVLIFHR